MLNTHEFRKKASGLWMDCTLERRYLFLPDFEGVGKLIACRLSL